MSRYIDADEAKRCFLDCAASQLRLDHIEDARAFKHAANYLDGIPTADVAPVVHGHWIVTDNGANGKTADCSVCGAHFVYFKGHLQMDKMPGCPKCLSKMDEEVNGDA